MVHHPPPMSPSPPPAGPASPTPPGPAPSKRKGWGRVAAVALAIGVVVGTVTGVGGFVWARGMTGADGTTRCGDGYLCFTSVEPDALIGFLRDHGYVCGETSADRCDLVTGSARYEVVLRRGEQDDQLRRYDVSVAYGHGVPLPAKATDYLAWFAALPFGDDDSAAEPALRWVESHQESEREDIVTATFGEFDYVITHRAGLDTTVELRVEAGTAWL